MFTCICDVFLILRSVISFFSTCIAACFVVHRSYTSYLRNSLHKSRDKPHSNHSKLHKNIIFILHTHTHTHYSFPETALAIQRHVRVECVLCILYICICIQCIY